MAIPRTLEERLRNGKNHRHYTQLSRHRQQLLSSGLLRRGFRQPPRHSQRLFEKSPIGGTSSVHWRDDYHTIPYRPY